MSLFCWRERSLIEPIFPTLFNPLTFQQSIDIRVVCLDCSPIAHLARSPFRSLPTNVGELSSGTAEP